MIIIFDGHKPEWLQHSIGHTSRRAQNLGHAMHRPGLRLERNFDEVTLRQRLSQPEQAARYRDGLQFSFRAASIFQTDRSQNGISELDPGRAPRGMRLGEVSHRSKPI